MMLYDGFIVRDDCILDWETVKNHPNVKNAVKLPRDWLLYEFHHELFNDPDFLQEPAWRNKMERFPELKESRIEMLKQERGLLAPWYANKKKPGDADAGIPGEICTYRVSTLGPMRWILFDQPVGWDTATKFTLRLDISAPGPPAILSDLLEEWASASQGEIGIRGGIHAAASVGVEVLCKRNRSGRWLGSLWTLLSDARWKHDTKQMTVAILEQDGPVEPA